MSTTIEEMPKNARPKAHYPPPPKPRVAPPHLLKWTAIAIIAAAALALGVRFAYHAWLYEETDDAYLSGHVHQISPQVDGAVQDVLVQDNQQVKAGDVLVRLDPLQYQIGVEKAQEAIEQAKSDQARAAAELAQADAQITEAQAHTTQAEAQVRQAQASLDLAGQNDERNVRTFQQNHGAVSKSDLDTTHSLLTARQADVEAANANLAAAKTSEVSAKCARDSAVAKQKASEAAVSAAQSELKEAQRQLARATIVAPSDGVVGAKNVETGNRVQAGETLLSLVEPDIWVVANYKETQLARMHPSQEVELTIDALPGETLHGRIDSIAPASGAQFALLPADNATGNFTKVVQRVPVKIIFDSATSRRLAGKLRPGLSAIVNVRVR